MQVTVILENGQKYDGDLLVGADGIWSKVRLYYLWALIQLYGLSLKNMMIRIEFLVGA